MNTVAKSHQYPAPVDQEEPQFRRVEVTDEYITAYFTDGRIVSVPLWWSWRLEEADPEQRARWEIIGAGRTVYWPEIDEHLSTQGFFSGTPALRPQPH